MNISVGQLLQFPVVHCSGLSPRCQGCCRSGSFSCVEILDEKCKQSNEVNADLCQHILVVNGCLVCGLLYVT